MPLPPNGSISLQGHSRPGEATTMPKIAMVVRMTEDALDALQNLSAADRIDFEFGDKPGIYIRDQLFSMRYDKERENQELFIRTTLPNRPNAALRLNANVVGKFAVEQVLSDKISQRIHNVTVAAAKQKANKKAILVDTPPVTPPAMQSKVTKKKAPPKNTAKSTTTIVKSYATTLPSQAAAAGTSASAALPKELATMYRQRLVHYLALGSASVPGIFKEFGGSEIDHNTRAGIMDILIEIAEQEQLPKRASSTVTTWRLKPQTWREVRPYQYSGYTDNVRTKVARTARQYLSSLKIPENDPAWDHVKFRDSSHGGTASNSQAAQRAMNGTSAAAAKAKAQKAKESKSKVTEVKIKTEAASRPSNTLSSLPAETNLPAERSGISVRSAEGKGRETGSEKEEGELSAPQSPPQVSAVPGERHSSKSQSNGTMKSLMPPPPVPVSSQSSSQLSSSSKRSVTVDPRRRSQADPTQRSRTTPPITSSSAGCKPVVAVKKKIEVTKKERASLPQGSRAVTSKASQSVKGKDAIKKEREREPDRESVRSMKKERGRESDRESLRGHDREKLVKASDCSKERDLEKPKKKEKKLKGQTVSRPAAKAAKRRASESSDESSDWGYENERFFQESATSRVKRERDGVSMKSSSSSLKVPRREASPPRQKTKREVSPLDPPKTKSTMERKMVSSTSAPQMVKREPKADSLTRSLTTKERKRRRSIDFTSSSEEEEVKPKVNAPKATKTGSSLASKNALHAKSRSTVSNKEDLQLRYSTVYAEYLSAFQKLVAQQNKARKVATVLGRDSESLSGDSDVDLDMMPLDELEELMKRHQRLYDELEEIKRKYTS